MAGSLSAQRRAERLVRSAAVKTTLPSLRATGVAQQHEALRPASTSASASRRSASERRRSWERRGSATREDRERQPELHQARLDAELAELPEGLLQAENPAAELVRESEVLGQQRARQQSLQSRARELEQSLEQHQAEIQPLQHQQSEQQGQLKASRERLREEGERLQELETRCAERLQHIQELSGSPEETEAALGAMRDEEEQLTRLSQEEAEPRRGLEPFRELAQVSGPAGADLMRSC